MVCLGSVNGLVIDGADTHALGVKNRLHLDIEVDDVEEAIEIVKALGGALVHVPTVEYGWRYAVLADPEGNGFCVIRRSEPS